MLRALIASFHSKIVSGFTVGRALVFRVEVVRGAIVILDDATIADMKAKRARDKSRDEAAKQQEAIENGATDWQAALKEWEDWEEGKAN